MRGPGIRTWLRKRGVLAAKPVEPRSGGGLEEFAAGPEDIERLRAEASDDFSRALLNNPGRPIHKWTQYLAAYDAQFAHLRGTDVGLLEIGVFHGGSLDLWRRYLGDRARIVGVDIDPACAARVSAPNRVEIGSQDDPAFLRGVVDRLGRLDVVLDDGSHMAKHQLASFEVLFPLLAPGGLYVIEDIHTSYWGAYDGGHGRAGTAVDLVRRLIDDMHAWYHEEPTTTPARDWVPALHVYDSVVFIEKEQRPMPQHLYVAGVGLENA